MLHSPWRLCHASSELYFVSSRLLREGARSAASVGLNAALYFPAVRGMDITVGARNILFRREEHPVQEDFDRQDGSILVDRIPGEGFEAYARVGYSFH